VLLFAAFTAIVIVQVRADMREGRLDFLARFWGVPAPAAREGRSVRAGEPASVKAGEPREAAAEAVSNG
jgi:hypothetical protein